MGNSARNLPEDLREAIRFITGRGSGAIKAIWNRQFGEIKDNVRALLPVLRKLRHRVDPELRETRARLRAPFLGEQSHSGFRRLARSASPGYTSPAREVFGGFLGMLSRGGISQSASLRFVAAKEGQASRAEKLQHEAISQTKKYWLRGPPGYTPKGGLWVKGELVVVNPAFRFGAQQVDKPRAADDLSGSSANEATFAKTPLKCVCYLIAEGNLAPQLWQKLTTRMLTNSVRLEKRPGSRRRLRVKI